MPNRKAPSFWCSKIKKGVVPSGWPLVRMLQYHATHLTQGHLQAIVGCGQLHRLTHLYLGMNHLKPPLASTLARHADQLPALQALSLYGNTLRGDDMTALAERLLNRLQYLNIGDCGLQDAEVLPLISSPQPQLRGLVIEGCDVRDETLDALMSTPHLPGLQVLALTSVMDRGKTRARRLIERAVLGDGLPHLRRAVWAGQLTRERPDALRQRCRRAGLTGIPRAKHELITRLLRDVWDPTSDRWFVGHAP